MSTQLDSAIKQVLDDISRKVATEVRRGVTVRPDAPAMQALEALAAIYPSTYRQWEGK